MKCNTLQSVTNVTTFKENLLDLLSGYILSTPWIFSSFKTVIPSVIVTCIGDSTN
jgi:hypothetical protein